MMFKNFVLALSVAIFCLSVNRSSAAQRSEELSILSSNLAGVAISELVPIFEKAHKIKVKVEYANNPLIKQRIEVGAKFDVVILEPKMLMELAKAGFVDKDSIFDLAKVGMVLVSKTGSPSVDIGSVESFKKVLLSASSVAYTADGHSGSVFLSTLEQIGLTDAMKAKLVPVVGRFSTLDVAEGKAQYTAFPGVGLGPGVQVAGQFPEKIQTYIGVSAATSSQATARGSVLKFLAFIQSESSISIFRSKGFAILFNGPDRVPIEKEPMHRLKFENECVRLFDVLVPVGGTTKYHEHLYDGVSVRVSNTQIVDESIAGERKPFDIKYGEATFGARPSPVTHRVVNSGKTGFRNIFVELLARKNVAAAVPFPVLSDGHVVLIDNDRVRVNRLILKPGESSKLHTHPMRGLGVILYDSKIEMISAEGMRRVMEPKAGDFVWQDAGTTHMIKNIGSKVFEAIDLELKHERSSTMSEFASGYAKAWSSKDPESVAKFYSESGWLKVNGGKPAVGRAQIAEVARGFMTAFPDMIVTLDKNVDNCKFIEFHWTLTGTNTGPGGKGKKVKISGREVWRIGPDGLIAESSGHFDEAEYGRQVEYGVQE